jgi:adenylate kinase
VRVALTGTPGTGKTTASERLPYRVLHLNNAIKDHDLWTDEDTERDSLVVDLDALAAYVDDAVDSLDVGDGEAGGAEADTGDTVVVLESHLAHLLDVDRVVVLRCRPDVLEARLRERGEPEAKATENAESEALDVVLSESVQNHGDERVYEIDTTDRTPDEVAAEVEATIEGNRDPSAGTVDFTDYLHR